VVNGPYTSVEGPKKGMIRQNPDTQQVSRDLKKIHNSVPEGNRVPSLRDGAGTAVVTKKGESHQGQRNYKKRTKKKAVQE